MGLSPGLYLETVWFPCRPPGITLLDRDPPSVLPQGLSASSSRLAPLLVLDSVSRRSTRTPNRLKTFLPLTSLISHISFLGRIVPSRGAKPSLICLVACPHVGRVYFPFWTSLFSPDLFRYPSSPTTTLCLPRGKVQPTRWQKTMLSFHAIFSDIPNSSKHSLPVIRSFGEPCEDCPSGSSPHMLLYCGSYSDYQPIDISCIKGRWPICRRT